MTYYDTIFCIHLCRLFANLGEFSFGNSIKEAIAFVQSLFFGTKSQPVSLMRRKNISTNHLTTRAKIHVEATEWLKNEQMIQEKNKSYAEIMKGI